MNWHRNTPNAPVIPYNNFSSNSPNEQMNRKYVVAGLIGFAVILGWNTFLIQRDAKLFEAYNQSITQIR